MNFLIFAAQGGTFSLKWQNGLPPSFGLAVIQAISNLEQVVSICGKADLLPVTGALALSLKLFQGKKTPLPNSTTDRNSCFSHYSLSPFLRHSRLQLILII